MFNRLAALLLAAALSASAQAAQPDLRSGLQSDLSRYLTQRAKPEHISAVSLSIYLPGNTSNINVTAGTSGYGGAGAAVTPQSLYQIGSITKSFTAATILQLEGEGRLTIDQTVGQWLPQYPAWKHITIRRLLNMTSRIPTYDDVRSMLAAYAANPMKQWTPQELVAVVYPKIDRKPPWIYSNTAYILSQLIIERATGNSYAAEIHRRFLDNPAIGLRSTFYESNLYPASVTRSMVSGYFYSRDPDNNGLQPLMGKDMRTLSVSWAQAAGAIVSTPDDVTRWCRVLYEGPVLKPKQRKELMSVVSLATGEPLAAPTPQNSRAFGLGVAEMYMPKMGQFWFYEGMTLGYRVAYQYFPKSNIVVAIGLNSQPPKKEDHVGQLMLDVYNRLQAAGKIPTAGLDTLGRGSDS